MKALKALLLIPLLPVLFVTLFADFVDGALTLHITWTLTNRVLDAVLS